MATMSLSRAGRTIFAAVAALAFIGIAAAEARPGKGSSMGSRGDRTYSAPPSTATAPNSAAPVERSMTRPDASPGMAAQRPAGAQPGGMFSRPGFLGGLLGAGLLGMLFGAGFFGGLGSLTAILGLILQAALIVGVIMLAVRFFRSRQAPAMAGAAAGAGAMARSSTDFATGGANAPGRGGSGPVAPSAAGPTDTVGIGPDDYDAFERNLKAVNAAWDAEDLAALRGLATPEMVSYFAEELAQNAGRGLHDRVSDVTLLQGDLAEAWREGRTDYATVAMRFSLVNAMVERAGGTVVEGNADAAQEVTELWTFRRETPGGWMLSAIQQA
jgi:predicted lipid-binding transport protein (Tim44 family)